MKKYFFVHFFIPYRPNAIKTALENGFAKCDIMISTGGMSMGEFDIMKDVLVEDFGAMIHFGRINMKPGCVFFVYIIVNFLRYLIFLPNKFLYTILIMFPVISLNIFKLIIFIPTFIPFNLTNLLKENMSSASDFFGIQEYSSVQPLKGKLHNLFLFLFLIFFYYFLIDLYLSNGMPATRPLLTR